MSRLCPEPLDRQLFFFTPDPERLVFQSVGFDRVFFPDRVSLIEHLVGGTTIASVLGATPQLNDAKRDECVANRPRPALPEVDSAHEAQDDASDDTAPHRFAAKKSLSSSLHASASTPLWERWPW